MDELPHIGPQTRRDVGLPFLQKLKLVYCAYFNPLTKPSNVKLNFSDCS